MKKVLVLFAHPKYEQSRVNRVLIDYVRSLERVTVHDLYEEYPDFNIEVEREKKLLMEHDIIVWHHPFYWYSCPPLLKQWIDLVLEYNWAYGPEGNALASKVCFNSISTGGSKEVYCKEGKNNYTISEFIRPFEQTARLCKMEYLPPFLVMGTHRLTEVEIKEEAKLYRSLLAYLSLEHPEIDLAGCDSLNNLSDLKTIEK